jgi:surface protein/predicted outer membrane repeat protein
MNLFYSFSLFFLVFSVSANSYTISNLLVQNTDNNGTGSLRQAILDASDGDTIKFHASIIGKSIILNTPIDITKSIKIEGEPFNLNTIDGANSTQLFTVTTGVTFEISNLILQNGYTTSTSGGAIKLTGAGSVLIAKNTVFQNNSAKNGGAISATSSVNKISFYDSHFEQNSVNGGGGNDGGSAIYSDAEILIENTSFINHDINYLNAQGTIGTGAGKLTMRNSTCVNNRSVGYSGCMTVQGDGNIIENSTIANNTATSHDGGGIRLVNGTLEIKNSVMYGNTAGGNGPDIALAGTTTLTSQGYNYISDTTLTQFNQTGDILNATDPKLGILEKDIDGVTWGYTIPLDSALVNEGNCTQIDGNTTTVDQFKNPRLGICDIGAKEYSFNITDNLVAYYTFENNASDISNNGYDATVNGIEYNTTSGKFGTAISFKNEGDVATISNINGSTPIPSGDENRTITFWANPSNITDYGYMFGYGASADKQRFTVMHREANLHNSSLGFSGYSAEVVTSTSMVANTWQHVAVTYDGNNITLYLNGTAINTTSVGVLNTNNTQPFNIGTSHTGGETTGSNIYEGLLDDFRIYNKALSPDDIATIYNHNKAIDTNCLNPNNLGLVGISGKCTGKLIVNRAILKEMIANGENVTNVYTGQITDMSELFLGNTTFNQNIDSWDTSNVEVMGQMFRGATSFNQDINSWDTSKVTDMSYMFRDTLTFNQPIGSWDTSKVTLMNGMFNGTTNFNQTINEWNVTNITSKPSNFDNLSGFEGNSSIQPQWGFAPLIGSDANDSLNGTNSSDIFIASKGHDTINGLDGNDTIIINAEQSTYNVYNNEDGTYEITNGVNTYTIENIEFVTFTDNLDINISTIATSKPKLYLKAHGGAIQFNTSSISNIIQPSDTLNIGTDHTIEFWTNTLESENEIIGLYDGTPTSRVFLSTGKITSQLIQTGSSSNIRVSQTAINDGEWHHIAMTYNSDGNMSIYINGILDETYQSDSVNNISLDNALLKIGSNGTKINSKMLLDDVRIWNTTRDPSQIKDNYKMQLDGNESGLIAYYNFDERVGSTIYDIAKNNYATIDTNITRLNFLGDTLDFDGIDDFIEIPDHNDLDITENITLSAWIKVDSFTGGGTIFSKFYLSDGTPDYAYELLLNDDGTLLFNSHDQLSPDNSSSNSTLSANRYYYITVTYNGENVKFYIDGELDKTVPTTGTLGSSTAPLLIGKRYLSSEDKRFFDGSIAEVSIWNRALTKSEIQHNMYSSLDEDKSNLVGYWPLREGFKVSQALDRQKNSEHNGTIDGATWKGNSAIINGDTIYTAQNIVTVQGMIVENNTSTATFTKDSNNTYITLDDEILIHKTTIEGNDTVSIKDTVHKLSNVFNIITYQSSSNINLNLSNLNLDDKNITGITLIGQDGVDQNISFNLDNIINGNNTFAEKLPMDGNYSIQFIVDDDNTYWYNFTLKKLFDTNTTGTQYKTSITSSSLDIEIDVSSISWSSASNRITVPNSYMANIQKEIIIDSGAIDKAWSIDRTNDGGFLVSSEYNWTSQISALWIKYDKDGNQEQNATYTPGVFWSGLGTSNGKYLFAGYTNTLPDHDATLFLYNSDGTLEKKSNDFNGTLINSVDIFADVIEIGSEFVAVGQTIDNDGKDFAYFIARFDSNLNLLSSKKIHKNPNSSDADIALDIATTNDGGYIISGWTNQLSNADAWVMKYDANDNQEWNTTISNGVKFADGIVQNQDGKYLVVGRDNSNGDIFITRLSSNGTIEADISIDSGVNKIDVAWEITPTFDGGYLIAGETENTLGSVSRDVYIIKTDKDGNPLWDTTIAKSGTDSYNWSREVIQLDTHKYALAGGFNNGSNDDTHIILFTAGPKELLLEAHGGAIQFNDTSSFIEIEKTTNLDIIGDITVEAKVYLDEYSEKSQILGFTEYMGDANGDENSLYYLLIHDDGDIRIGHEYGSGTNAYLDTTSKPITLGKWHHITALRDSSKKLFKIYVDGVLVKEETYSSNPSNGKDSFLKIGGNINDLAEPTYVVKGLIDDIRIWDDLRTQKEILSTIDRQLDGNETNLVAYYNFDERVDTTIYDSSSNGAHGTIIGEATRINFLNKGLYFDGTDDYLETNLVPTFNGLDDITISTWIKTGATSGAIFDISASDIGEYNMILKLDSSGKIRFEYNKENDEWNQHLSNSVINDNLWHHITIVKKGNNTSLYIDGKLDTTFDAIYSVESATNNSAVVSFARIKRDNTLHYTGYISEVSLWNKALNENSIINIMHSPLNGKENELIAYWPLDEGNGTTIKNKTSDANNGTITNAKWIDNAPKIYGDTIYTTQGVSTIHKVFLENNTSTTNYTDTSSLSTISNFNATLGNFTYYNIDEINETITGINGISDSKTYNTTFNTIVYENLARTTIIFDSVNLFENNITSITLVATSQNEQDIILDISSLQNGTNELSSVTIAGLTYSIKVTTSDNRTWWYNFSTGKLDENYQDMDDFKYTFSSSVLTINSSKENWVRKNKRVSIFDTTWSDVKESYQYFENNITANGSLEFSITKKTNDISKAEAMYTGLKVKELLGEVDLLTIGDNSYFTMMGTIDTPSLNTAYIDTTSIKYAYNLKSALKVYNNKIYASLYLEDNTTKHIIKEEEIYNTTIGDTSLIDTNLNLNIWSTLNTIYMNITDINQTQIGKLFKYTFDESTGYPNAMYFTEKSFLGVIDDRNSNASISLRVNVLSSIVNDKLSKTYYKIIPEFIHNLPLEKVTDLNTSDITSLGERVFYKVNNDKDINGYPLLRIEQLKYENNITIQTKVSINSKGKIISKENNKNVLLDKLIKYESSINSDDLTPLYSQSYLPIKFSSQATAYDIYTQQKDTSCKVIEKFSNLSYSSINDFIQDYTKVDIVNKYLLENKITPLDKFLLFGGDGVLQEYNTQSVELANVGSYTIQDNISCINTNNTNITFSKFISLQTTTLTYDDIAFGYDGTHIYKIDYKEKGQIKSHLLLNKEAAKDIVKAFAYNIKTTIEKPITNTWTYISMPSSITLCLDSYQNDINLTSVCNQDYDIESVFSKVTTILKYNGDWSYWDSNTSVLYNINKLSSITAKDGLFIKSINKTTLNLPYDIFEPISNKILSLYKPGWYLVGNNFDNSVNEIVAQAQKQGKVLRYILKYKESDNSWGVFAPLNDADIDSNIKRIESIEKGESYWLNID